MASYFGSSGKGNDKRRPQPVDEGDCQTCYEGVGDEVFLRFRQDGRGQQHEYFANDNTGVPVYDSSKGVFSAIGELNRLCGDPSVQAYMRDECVELETYEEPKSLILPPHIIPSVDHAISFGAAFHGKLEKTSDSAFFIDVPPGTLWNLFAPFKQMMRQSVHGHFIPISIGIDCLFVTGLRRPVMVWIEQDNAEFAHHATVDNQGGLVRGVYWHPSSDSRTNSSRCALNCKRDCQGTIYRCPRELWENCHWRSFAAVDYTRDIIDVANGNLVDRITTKTGVKCYQIPVTDDNQTQPSFLAYFCLREFFALHKLERDALRIHPYPPLNTFVEKDRICVPQWALTQAVEKIRRVGFEHNRRLINFDRKLRLCFQVVGAVGAAEEKDRQDPVFHATSHSQVVHANIVFHGFLNTDSPLPSSNAVVPSTTAADLGLLGTPGASFRAFK